MGTKTVISSHTRARIEYAFELVYKGATVTVLSYAEVKALVLRALAAEFDNDIMLTSSFGAKLPLSAVIEDERATELLDRKADAEERDR